MDVVRATRSQASQTSQEEKCEERELLYEVEGREGERSVDTHRAAEIREAKGAPL